MKNLPRALFCLDPVLPAKKKLPEEKKLKSILKVKKDFHQDIHELEEIQKIPATKDHHFNIIPVLGSDFFPIEEEKTPQESFYDEILSNVCSEAEASASDVGEGREESEGEKSPFHPTGSAFPKLESSEMKKKSEKRSQNSSSECPSTIVKLETHLQIDNITEDGKSGVIEQGGSAGGKPLSFYLDPTLPEKKEPPDIHKVPRDTPNSKEERRQHQKKLQSAKAKEGEALQQAEQNDASNEPSVSSTHVHDKSLERLKKVKFNPNSERRAVDGPLAPEDKEKRVTFYTSDAGDLEAAPITEVDEIAVRKITAEAEIPGEEGGLRIPPPAQVVPDGDPKTGQSLRKSPDSGSRSPRGDSPKESESRLKQVKREEKQNLHPGEGLQQAEKDDVSNEPHRALSFIGEDRIEESSRGEEQDDYGPKPGQQARRGGSITEQNARRGGVDTAWPDRAATNADQSVTSSNRASASAEFFTTPCPEKRLQRRLKNSTRKLSNSSDRSDFDAQSSPENSNPPYRLRSRTQPGSTPTGLEHETSRQSHSRERWTDGIPSSGLRRLLPTPTTRLPLCTFVSANRVGECVCQLLVKA